MAERGSPISRLEDRAGAGRNGNGNGNGTIMVAKLIRSYWQLATMLILISGSFVAIRLKLMLLDSLADEVEVQSKADSAAVQERWTTMVGVEYLICALRAHRDASPTDTVRSRRAQQPDDCDVMLRFVPELTDEIIPRLPNVQVWRNPNGKGGP